MDKAQREALLLGIPLLSDIVSEVFLESVHRYEFLYKTNRERQRLFDVRRQEAILTAPRDDDQTPRDATRGGWVYEYGVIPGTLCQKSDLRLGNGIQRLGGNVHKAAWHVSAWLPRELSIENRPDLHELLPLPERSLQESEWLVVFWAITEANRKEAPEQDEDEDSGVWQITAIGRLVGRLLGQERVGDDERFGIGRDKVIAVLCRECFLCSLQNGWEKTGIELIVFDGSDRPKFLPTGWKSSYWPVSDNLEAVRQWLSCTMELLLYWQESLHGVEANDIVSVSMARQARQDAWLLACHVRDNHSIKNGPPELADDSLSAVPRYLDGLSQAIDQAGAKPKSSGLSLAEYNNRAMQAAKKDRTFAEKPTVRKWSTQLGCATGLVSQLPFYILCAEQAGTRRKGQPPKPKIMSLEVLPDNGERDEELDRLIGEQRRDAEPSPLEADVPGHPQKVRAGKKL